jgi:hypothetical protein
MSRASGRWRVRADPDIFKETLQALAIGSTHASAHLLSPGAATLSLVGVSGASVTDWYAFPSIPAAAPVRTGSGRANVSALSSSPALDSCRSKIVSKTLALSTQARFTAQGVVLEHVTVPVLVLGLPTANAVLSLAGVLGLLPMEVKLRQGLSFQRLSNATASTAHVSWGGGRRSSNASHATSNSRASGSRRTGGSRTSKASGNSRRSSQVGVDEQSD